MKKSIIILLAVLFVAIFALGGCAKAEDPTTDDPAVSDAASVDEDGAKAIALEDAGVPETAAEDLTVTSEEVDGEQVYVIAFVWSGFDYQYTVSASTGEIVETIFDGEVLN
ncbi:MAG: hypothetical protein E7513_02420 [Ruminococcaceae bacterium]|nr:hypothetical protein [Oscillospiraceae bacterium]